ncbi:MAG: hypothetical protein GC179_25345 [Anaerolineaceae bacterium]|nr:hypothetical protein [Anaerolineaceae bacterium]
MPYEVSWYIERRVVSTVLTGDLSLRDAESASLLTSEFILKGQPPLVHLIADTTNLGKFPTNLSLLNGEASHHLRNPLLGWMIVISSSTATRFVSSIMTQVARVRFRMFATWDQSIDFLLNQDETLRELMPTKTDPA